MNSEIKTILNNAKDGEKVLEYIEQLEEYIERKPDNHECNCHHDDDCHCGCHDNDESEWEEISVPYVSTLKVYDWEKLLKNSKIFTIDALKVMKRMRHIAAPTSSMELADTFGLGAMYYRLECEKLEEKLLPFVQAENLKTEQRWAIIFNGWRNRHSGEEIYALQPELYEAIGNIDLSMIALREGAI